MGFWNLFGKKKDSPAPEAPTRPEVQPSSTTKSPTTPETRSAQLKPGNINNLSATDTINRIRTEARLVIIVIRRGGMNCRRLESELKSIVEQFKGYIFIVVGQSYGPTESHNRRKLFQEIGFEQEDMPLMLPIVGVFVDGQAKEQDTNVSPGRLRGLINSVERKYSQT